ncbi:MAG: Hsp33 family molecular chaperone HslO, partial [Gallionellaceae bacterium]|nr:Hsp33 family molecular chaperone HslO [Gallionellaceae bacterium]
QGVVALDGAKVAEGGQNYMLRSEQVETALWLAADDRCAAGLLLQQLPLEGGRGATAEHGEETWQRAAVLAATLRPEELLTLSAETLLHRLYHEDDVRLFEPQVVVFRCSCSREKVTGMLKLLGAEEVHAALQELGELEVRCEFCNRAYRFDAVDVERIFAADVAVDGGKSLH